MKDSYYVVTLRDLGDERGGLNVIEAEKQIPFPIKRVFYNYNSLSAISRGVHANKNSRFALVSVTGTCVVDVDDGKNKESFILDSPKKMLVINRLVWKVMRSFSSDNVLLIVSDNYYDQDEYIYDYQEFLQIINK